MKINLQAVLNTATINNKNKSSSASICVSIGLGSAGGITGNASFNSSRGSANGTDTTYTETVIQSGNVSTGSGQSGSDGTVTLQNGADTNIIDSEVIGNQVIANAGFPLPNPLPAGVALMECNEIKG